MCVIFWTTYDPHYSLVIASNRDEFLSRPTLQASWHDFSSSSSSSASSSPDQRILSARDATGGGTWLGVTQNGAFATLTNFTELSAPLPPGLNAFESRGRLVRDWLVQSSEKTAKGKGRSTEETKVEIEEYLQGVKAKLDRFPGFNLLIGALSSQGTVVGYITNRTADGSLTTDRNPDIFVPATPVAPSTATMTPKGMSNSTLTQPWAKVTSGSLAFRAALETSRTQGESGLVEELFDLLWTSSTPAPRQRSELRNSVLISPLELPVTKDGGREWYATRTSTVILIARDGKAKLVERDTFKVVGGEARLINGPERSGATQGRSEGQRVFTWTID